MKLFGQSCDLVNYVLIRISLGMYVDPRCHHRVRKEDSLKEGGGRQCPGRYGEQTYRGDAKETEEEQRHGRGGQGRKRRRRLGGE